MDVDKVFQWLPSAFPCGDTVFGEMPGGWGEPNIRREVLGLAQYLVEEWRKCKMPYMSMNSWVRFIKIIAGGHPELQALMDIADCYEDTDEDVHKYSEKSIKKYHWRRQQAGYRNSTMNELKAKIAGSGKDYVKYWDEKNE